MKHTIHRSYLLAAMTALLALIGLAVNAAGQNTENIRAWGSSASGQLGIGMDDQNDYEKLPGPVSNLTGVAAVTGGSGYSVALKNDGTVWTWGSNSYGALGNGGRGANIVPMALSDPTGVVAVAAGEWHSLALKKDGTVWAWGVNGSGQLGNWKYLNGFAPEQVRDLTSVTAVSGGGTHSLALKGDGTVWAWGNNSSGQLGDGNGGGVNTSNTPVAVVNLTGVTAIAAGGNHSLALKSDGTVWAWGDNGTGQLGDGAGGPYIYSVAPVKVLNLTGVVAVAAGAWHSLALKSDGTVWAWGSDYYGELGVGGSNSNSTTPVAVNKLAGVVKIAAGIFLSMALKADGSAWIWGANEYGQLGNGSTVPSNVPVPNLTGVLAIGVGTSHAMAIKTNGVVWAWGSNWGGQLGNGRGLYVPEPLAVPGVSNGVTVAAGNYCSAVLTSDGTVWAWGYDQSDICSGASAKRNVPVAIGNLTPAVAIAVGRSHRLALKGDGSVWGWGRNSGGQLGNGSTTRYFDVPVMAGISNVVAIAGGGEHSLALKGDGAVWAWGANLSGQLGSGDPGHGSAAPVAIGNLAGVVAIAAGGSHSLALKSDGTVWAWGENADGQLGNGNNTDISFPLAVLNLTGVVAIAAGERKSLALKSDGTVWRWGAEFQFQSNVPAAVPDLSGVVAVAAGRFSSLALKADGTVWRWGNVAVPVLVPNLTGAVAIAVGEAHSLAAVAGGIPVIAVQPAAVSFGLQKPGTTSSNRSISVINNGEAPLEIRSVKLTGVDVAEFKKPADTCNGATLMPHGSCGINVKFAPKAEGTRSAAVMLLTNAPGGPHLVFLSGMALTSTPFTTIVAPNGGEKIPTRSAFNIQWTAASPLPLTSFDILYSSDAGANFSAISGCTGLAATARSCAWTAPGAVTTSGRIRVVAHNSGGNTAADTSDSDFSIVTEKATPGVFLDGKWYLDVNGDGFFVYGTDKDYSFGWPGTTAVTGDWNGDRKKEIGVFHEGAWYLDYNGNGTWDGFAVDRGFGFGWAGVTPMVGDWNGDRKEEIGVFKDGWWYLDLNGNGVWEAGIDMQASFGWVGVTPVLGDWNGDGKTEIGVFKDGWWYLDLNGNGAWDGFSTDKGFGFGWGGVTPLVGDWNGDGKAEVGVFKDGWWYLDLNGNGIWEAGVDRQYSFGYPGVTPMVGDWNADGKAEIAVFDRGYYYMDINGDGTWNPYTTDFSIALLGAGAPVVGSW